MRIHFILILLISSYLVNLEFANCQPTQHLWVPEAFVLPQGHCRMDLQNQFSVKKSEALHDPYDYGVGGSCGVYKSAFYSIPVAVELGLDWRESSDRNPKSVIDPLQLHVQASILDLRQGKWGIGLGMSSIGFSENTNDTNMAYTIIQNFSDPWLIGLGGYSGNPNLLVDHNGQAASSGVMAGVWRYTSKAVFSLEWMSGLSRVGALVVGGGVILPGNTRISLGVGLANNRESGSDWVLLKVSLDFAWLNAMKKEMPFELYAPQF
jgi:hypothetical protein